MYFVHVGYRLIQPEASIHQRRFDGVIFSVIGSAFYLMDYLPGRVFTEPHLPSLPPAQRTQTYNAMIDVLVDIHKVDVNRAGLQQFGPPGKSLFCTELSEWNNCLIIDIV